MTAVVRSGWWEGPGMTPVRASGDDDGLDELRRYAVDPATDQRLDCDGVARSRRIRQRETLDRRDAGRVGDDGGPDPALAGCRTREVGLLRAQILDAAVSEEHGHLLPRDSAL